MAHAPNPHPGIDRVPFESTGVVRVQGSKVESKNTIMGTIASLVNLLNLHMPINSAY